jgi:hypothetical protein
MPFGKSGTALPARAPAKRVTRFPIRAKTQFSRGQNERL